MLGLILKAITSIGFWHFVFKTTLLAAGIGALAWLFLWSLSLSGYVPLLLIALASWIFAAPPQAAYQLYHWVFRTTPAADIADPNDFPALDLSDDAQRDDALKYYDYFRDEIKREDEITHQRVTWTTTFQGFIISAMTLLLILDWDGTRKIVPLGRISLFAIGIMGASVGLVSFMGILASRRSTMDAIAAWDRRNAQWGLFPKHVPQAHGQQSAFTGGHTFAVLMPALFIVMWTLFLTGYTVLSYFTWMQPCLGGSDLLRCMFLPQAAPVVGSSP